MNRRYLRIDISLAPFVAMCLSSCITQKAHNLMFLFHKNRKYPRILKRHLIFLSKSLNSRQTRAPAMCFQLPPAVVALHFHAAFFMLLCSFDGLKENRIFGNILAATIVPSLCLNGSLSEEKNAM